MALGSFSWSVRNEPSSVVGIVLRCASSWTVVSIRVLFFWLLGTSCLLLYVRYNSGTDLVHCHIWVVQLHVIPLPEATPLVDSREPEVHGCTRLSELGLAPLAGHLDEEMPVGSPFPANAHDEVGDVVLLLAYIGIGNTQAAAIRADAVVFHPCRDSRQGIEHLTHLFFPPTVDDEAIEGTSSHIDDRLEGIKLHAFS